MRPVITDELIEFETPVIAQINAAYPDTRVFVERERQARERAWVYVVSADVTAPGGPVERAAKVTLSDHRLRTQPQEARDALTAAARAVVTGEPFDGALLETVCPHCHGTGYAGVLVTSDYMDGLIDGRSGERA